MWQSRKKLRRTGGETDSPKAQQSASGVAFSAPDTRPRRSAAASSASPKVQQSASAVALSAPDTRPRRSAAASSASPKVQQSASAVASPEREKRPRRSAAATSASVEGPERTVAEPAHAGKATDYKAIFEEEFREFDIQFSGDPDETTTIPLHERKDYFMFKAWFKFRQMDLKWTKGVAAIVRYKNDVRKVRFVSVDDPHSELLFKIKEYERALQEKRQISETYPGVLESTHVNYGEPDDVEGRALNSALAERRALDSVLSEPPQATSQVDFAEVPKHIPLPGENYRRMNERIQEDLAKDYEIRRARREDERNEELISEPDQEDTREPGKQFACVCLNAIWYFMCLLQHE
jgi:hypothetical protein